MPQPAPGTTAKTLGFTSLVCLIIANMIGAGIFTTSGFALSDLGSADRVMAAWVVGGVIALCGALSYAGLVRYITESGGEYLFLSRLIHPLAGFITGWVSLLAGFTGAIAFAARAFETYAFPTRPDWLPNGVAAAGMVLVAAILHGVKVQVGALAQNIVVFLKVVLLIGFLAIAASVAMTQGAAPAPPPEMPFSLAAFAGSLVWISLSYSGSTPRCTWLARPRTRPGWTRWECARRSGRSCLHGLSHPVRLGPLPAAMDLVRRSTTGRSATSCGASAATLLGDGQGGGPDRRQVQTDRGDLDRAADRRCARLAACPRRRTPTCSRPTRRSRAGWRSTPTRAAATPTSTSGSTAR